VLTSLTTTCTTPISTRHQPRRHDPMMVGIDGLDDPATTTRAATREGNFTRVKADRTRAAHALGAHDVNI
jgi:hypothetical protein